LVSWLSTQLSSLPRCRQSSSTLILAAAVALFAGVIFDFLVSGLAMADFERMPIWVMLLSAAFLAELAVVVVLVVALVLSAAPFRVIPLVIFGEGQDARILQ
jgi:hypothetical protein